MCALKMPFDASNLPSLSLKIVKGTYNPLPTSFTKDLRVLISTMLNVEMNKRPSINEILRQNIIKSRIKNYLNEMEYDKEFSHTIIHKFNVLAPKPEKNIEIIKKNENKANVISNIVPSKVNNINVINNSKDYSSNVNPINVLIKNELKENNQIKSKKVSTIRDKNKKEMLNPNFRKINEIQGKNENFFNLKIEIFEPKKKPQQSEEKVIIHHYNNINENKKFQIVNSNVQNINLDLK